MQLVAQIRRVRRVVPGPRRSCWSPTTTTTTPASRCARGTTGPSTVVVALVDDALTTLAVLEGASLDETQVRRSASWPLSPAKTSSPETKRDLADHPGHRPDRIISVVDPESRHVHKTVHNYRDGFKGHIAVEPDTGLITACDLTAGNVGDARAAAGLLEGEPAGTEVLADSAYGSGGLRHRSQAPSTRRSSSRFRSTMRSKVALASTTSSSTPWRARSPAPTVSASPSPAPTRPTSGSDARDVRCATLHHVESGATSMSTNTTTSSSPLADTP